MAPLVRFDAVSVTFGEQRILIDADFAISLGERVCLIGRNGSGKSTTLKLISGSQQADDGAVEKPARLFGRLLGDTIRAKGNRLLVSGTDLEFQAASKLSGTLSAMDYDAAMLLDSAVELPSAKPW